MSRSLGDRFKNLLSTYVKSYTEALNSGLFLFGCHPDVFFSSYRDWDANSKAASIDILQCAKDCNIPLEINDYGLRKPTIQTSCGERHKYPVKEFWELAKDIGIKVTTNSDAHDPKDVQGKPDGEYLTGCYRLANEIGLDFVSWSIENNHITWINH